MAEQDMKPHLGIPMHGNSLGQWWTLCQWIVSAEHLATPDMAEADICQDCARVIALMSEAPGGVFGQLGSLTASVNSRGLQRPIGEA